MSMSIFKTIAKALIFNNSKIENINKQVDKNSKSIKDLKKSVSTSDMPTIELDLKILNLSDLTAFDSNVDVTPEVIKEFLGFEPEGNFSQNLLKLHNRKFIIKLMNRWNFNNNYFEVYSSSICSGRVMAYGSTNIFVIVIPFYDSNGDQYELYFQANDYSQTGFFSIISRTETYSKFAKKDDITNLTNEIIANEEVHAAALNDLNERLNNVGGSSSGSGVYAEVNHGTSDTTFALTPNTFHVWDEVSALTLTLGSETSGIANEYLFQFTSGTTATTLSLPSDLKWTEELVIEPNMIYQVSILKGMVSVLEFSNASLFPITITVGESSYYEVYSHFMTNYSLPDSSKPSNAISISEQIIVEDSNDIVSGTVIKASIGLSNRLFLFTEKSISNYYAVYIDDTGFCSTYFYD